MRYELQKYSSHEKNIHCQLGTSLGSEHGLKNEICGLILQM